MKRFIFIFLIALSGGFYTSIEAQYQITNFTTFNTGTNSLGSNTLYQFKRNPVSGDLWINSKDGLMYYNGIDFYQNSISLNGGHRTISGDLPFTIDLGGYLWFVHSDSLYAYNGMSLQSWIMPAETYGVNDLLFDHNDVLWIATNNGAFKFDSGIFELITTTDGLLSNSIQCIFIDINNNIWLGSNSGINSWDGTAWKSYDQSDGVSFQNGSSGVFQIYQDGSGRIWALGYGVLYLDNQFWEELDLTQLTSSSINLNDFTSAFETQNGLLYFGTSSFGLVYRENGVWNRFTTNDGLPSDSILTAYKDDNGEIYLGHQYHGMSTTFDGFNYSNINSHDGGIVENNTKKIYVDSAEQLWLINPDAYQLSSDQLSWEKFFEDQHHTGSFIGENRNGTVQFFGNGDLYTYSENIWNIIHNWDYTGGPFIEKDQYVYVAYNYELKRFIYQNEDTLSLATTFDFSTYFPVGTTIICLEVDSSNTLWMGTNNGLWYLDQISAVNLPLPESLSDMIYDIRTDIEGGLWIATADGAGKYKNGVWSVFHDFDGLPDNVVRQFEITPDSAIWFATGKGVSRLKNEIFSNILKADGLVDHYCMTIRKDYQGNIWVGTIHGISKLHNAFIIYQDTTSIESNQLTQNVLVYPNPTKGLLNIELVSSKVFGDNGSIHIEIYSSNGTLVKKEEYISSQAVFDISNFPKGIYLLKVYSGNSYSKYKVVLE